MKYIKTLFLLTLLTLNSFGLTSQTTLNQTIINPYLPTGGFVGQIKDSEIFIAIVTTNSETIAYICDGVKVAEWFRGSMAESGWLELTSKKGWKLRASMSTSNAIGSLILEDSKRMFFIARPIEGKAGLYRAEKTMENIKYVGGWIVNAKGEQRGAVVGGGTFQAVPNINMENFQTEVVELGNFATQLITPSYFDGAVKP